jgi:hypothetical protein
MAKMKTTQKGTELPLMNLKGKDYLEVKYRLVWFREEYPNGSIQTEVVENGDVATAKATIAVPVDGNYIVLSTGHKRESKENFGDNYEKAETGAIGRALAAAGFGTQFEPEFDEGERIVDAPVETKVRSKFSSGPKPASGNGPKEAPKAGAQNSQGTAAYGSGTVAGANPELRVVEAGAPGAAKDAPHEEAYTKKLIAAQADVIVNIKKVKTAAELKRVLADKYKVTKKDDLTAEQAKEFLDYLNQLSA